MYKKMAALLLAVALLCGCAAQVTVQRIPAELPKAESPAATPTPEPMPTFTEEQKKYGSASLLSEPTVLVSVFDLGRGRPHRRRAANPDGRGLDHSPGQKLRRDAGFNL